MGKKTLSFFAFVLSVSVFSAPLPQEKESLRKVDDGLAVSLTTGTAYKVLVSTPLDLTRTQSQWLNHDEMKESRLNAKACGLLGDGWHAPTQTDIQADRDGLAHWKVAEKHPQQGFWLRNGRIANFRGEVYSGDLKTNLPGVCVCGPDVDTISERRTRSRCLGFRSEDATVTKVPERKALQKLNGEYAKMDRGTAEKTCRQQGRRLPVAEELASLDIDLQIELGGKGCLWSSSESGKTSHPYIVWSLDFYKDSATKSGPTYVRESKACYALCVL